MARRLKSAFLGAFALFLFCGTPALADPAAEFIRSISAKAFSSLGQNDITDEARVERFRNLLNESFDLDYIGNFVLGVHGRRASDEEKAEFQKLFEKFVVQAYANRFRDLTDKKLSVIRADELNKRDTLVVSRIEIAGQPPIPVNWKVRSKGDTQKIIDVTVEGISMSVTQRDEFGSVIRQNNGKVSGLNRALRRKIGD